MSTFTAPDISAVMKEFVNPVLQEQFEQSRTLYNMWGEGGEPINERGTRFSSRVRENPSFGWYSESGAFPTPGKEKYIEQKVFVTRCASGFEFSGDFLSQVDNQENLIKGLTNVLSNYTDTAKKRINQALYGDGTGELGVVVSRDSATAATFATTTANGSLFGVRKLIIDGEYHFYSSAGVARTAGGALAIVTARSQSAGTATFDSTSDIPTDVVATDVIVFANSYNKAVLGLKKHINNDSGSYQGQSRSTYPELKGDLIDTNGSALTTALLNKAKYRLRYRTSEESAMNVTLLSAGTQYDLYSRIGFNFIRFNQQGGTFRQDFEKVQHGQSQWIIDVDCDEDRVYGLDMGTFKKHVLEPFGVLRADGLDMRMYFSNGAGSDKYTGWMGSKFNISCRKPNANFVLTELSVSDGALGFESLQA